jgi:hypothetical protein
MDRNIGIVPQLEQVIEPYCTMFEGLKGRERSNYHHSTSADKRKTLKFFFVLRRGHLLEF